MTPLTQVITPQGTPTLAVDQFVVQTNERGATVYLGEASLDGGSMKTLVVLKVSPQTLNELGAVIQLALSRYSGEQTQVPSIFREGMEL